MHSTPTEGVAVTVAQYLTQWLQLQRSQLQPSTWQSYRTYVVHYLAPAFADTELAELTPAQLSTFYASLQQAVGFRGRPLALRTIQYCHGVIHKALNDAVRLEILPRNVAMNATLPRVDLRDPAIRGLRRHRVQHLAEAVRVLPERDQLRPAEPVQADRVANPTS